MGKEETMLHVMDNCTTLFFKVLLCFLLFSKKFLCPVCATMCKKSLAISFWCRTNCQSIKIKMIGKVFGSLRIFTFPQNSLGLACWLDRHFSLMMVVVGWGSFVFMERRCLVFSSSQVVTCSSSSLKVCFQSSSTNMLFLLKEQFLPRTQRNVNF